MVVKTMTPKVQASGFIDVLAIGLSKKVTETLLTGIIGNGTIKSGAVKIGLGAVTYSKMGKMGNIVSSGLAIDGAEDVITALMPSVAGNEATASNW